MRLFYIITVAIILATPVSAEVKYDEPSRSLTVSGGTTNWQRQQVSDAFTKYKIDTVYLSGNGGLFYAGLAIGREIRASNARVIVPSGTTCVSACSLAAIAASDLLIDGVLLFHRPFMTGVSTLTTLEEFAGMVGRGYLDMASYIVEMGLPLSFAKSIIWDTSPCKFLKIDDTDHLTRIRGAALAMPNMSFERVNNCTSIRPKAR